MNDFVFHTPTKVFFGRGGEKKVGEILRSYGFSKVLFHYGSGSIKRSGLYDTVVASLKDAGISFVELGGVEANPKVSLARKAAKLAREEKVDLILAVGGGSVLDSSKAAAAGAYYNCDPWEFSTKKRIPEKALPVGTILTLSASGSEMSDSCVLTNEENWLKRGFNAPCNRPLFSILNPELTFTVGKFQTGCGMVTTTAYPKTAFRIPYIHNLFQNGAATLSGLVEVFEERQKRGEYPKGEITFIMASGDGGMDIGMGSALGTALRGHHLLLFEYDNGGYMNTGYQLSYSTPMGAKSSTSHLGKTQYGKTFFHKDMPQIMAATHLPYVATVAESNPNDFIKKAAKAAAYAREFGTAYVKALSACPLNWNDRPDTERKVIAAAVDCCYFPLYEIERGITSLSYDPKKSHKKIPVTEWFSMMGRTKHLATEEYKSVADQIQAEVDRRYERLAACAEHPLL